ncbi:methyl-accepting chemotaxis protein [Marinobacter sp.]|uniref:methyl-accepting chemotaxis protein n=1 Tax=Marinobacter sp. TaxID=50741 RepID=UPI003850D574
MKTTEHAVKSREKTDRYMLFLLLAHVPVVGFLVPWGYGTLTFALVTSICLAAISSVGFALLKGTRAFSSLVAMALMLFSVIMIQTQMGRIEMHFHIFAALAFLLVYKDWLPVVVAALTIAVHHFLFTALQLNEATLGGLPIMIFSYGCSWSIAWLHAAFVIFEAAVLVAIAVQQNTAQQAADGIIEAIERFERENDLSVQIDTARDNHTVQSFNRMLSGFGGVVSQLKQAIGSIAGSSDNLASINEQTSRVVQSQTDHSAQAATAIHEMSATAHEIARNAGEAARAAEEATAEAATGRASVTSAVDAFQVQNSVLSSTAEALNRLVAVVKNIGETTSAIQGISQQTNLLALNAAIEAARAGEAGRGFSVVADEVRSLSVKTQTSAEQIQAMIETLRNGTDEVVRSMGLGQERAEETASHVNASGEAIGRILEAIAKVQAMNDQIATAAEQQSSVSEEINQSMSTISAQSESLAEKAADGSEASVALNGTLADLRRTVEVYRTA